MRITATEEYGLRCLLTLAKRGPGVQMRISEIADREGLSVPYVTKLMAILRKAGLVNAVRGRGGGFVIARTPDKMNLYEVLSALGGPLLQSYHCQKYTGQLEECVHIEDCSVHEVLHELSGRVRDYLSHTTLEDLAGPTAVNEASRRDGLEKQRGLKDNVSQEEATGA